MATVVVNVKPPIIRAARLDLVQVLVNVHCVPLKQAVGMIEQVTDDEIYDEVKSGLDLLVSPLACRLVQTIGIKIPK